MICPSEQCPLSDSQWVSSIPVSSRALSRLRSSHHFLSMTVISNPPLKGIPWMTSFVSSQSTLNNPELILHIHTFFTSAFNPSICLTRSRTDLPVLSRILSWPSLPRPLRRLVKRQPTQCFLPVFCGGIRRQVPRRAFGVERRQCVL